MMRITTLVFVCSTIAGCSWGGDGGGTGPGGTGPDAAVSHAPVCGDSVCSASEVGNCTADCGSGGGNTTGPVCGNGTCETGETSASCPNDCGGGGGSGSGSGALNCSDQNTTINCLLCTSFQLCTAPYDAASCAACGGGGLGGDILCTGGAPDGTCDAMESNSTCPTDCP